MHACSFVISWSLLSFLSGCQLLADALGGRVYRADRMEAGYATMRLSEAGRADPLLADLFARLQREGLADEEGRTDVFLTHHQDTFDLPAELPVLAQSERVGDCAATGGFRQIFRSRRALAVQFHPEASHAELAQWTAFLPERYPAIGTSADALVADSKQRAERANKAARAFFDTFWKHMGLDQQATQQAQQQQQK